MFTLLVQGLFMTPTIDLLRSHRSIRAFTDKPVSDEQREAIIAAAQGASTSSFCNALQLSASPVLHCAKNWSATPAVKNTWPAPLNFGFSAPISTVISRLILKRN